MPSIFSIVWVDQGGGVVDEQPIYQWRRNQGGAGCWRTPINFASYVGTPSLPNTHARDTAGPGVDHYTIDTDYTELEWEWDFAT